MSDDEKELGPEEAIREAAGRAAAAPDNPEAAVELHKTLVRFGKDQRAAQVAGELESKFDKLSHVQVYLGEWYEAEGNAERAEACFARAFKRDRQSRRARQGVALAALRKGDLHRARKLLAFMMQPGPDQDPAVLVRLADAFHSRGNHDRALDLYQTALGASPRLGFDNAVRTKVRRSEQALGRSESILPKKPRSKAPRVLAVAAVAVLAVLTYLNHAQANRRALHILNGLAAPVTVTIDGDRSCRVPAGGKDVLTLPEGQHHAVVTQNGKTVETVDIEMRTGFFERIRHKPVFVLNVRAAAVLQWQEVLYGGEAVKGAKARYRLYFGESFLSLRDIDFVLGPAPRAVKTAGPQATRTRLSVVDLPPVKVIALFPDGTTKDTLLKFIEHFLTVRPYDADLPYAYCLVAFQGQEVKRCRAFLDEGLARRPVAVDWHIACQTLAADSDSPATLVARYDKMLAREPGNSSLLFLKGRLLADPREAMALYDRAIAADPANPYPWQAKAQQLLWQGHFPKAKEAADRAHALRPASAEVNNTRFRIRFALREIDPLIAQVEAERKKSPLDFALQRRLLKLLFAKGDRAAARKAHEQYARLVRAKRAKGGEQLALRSQLALLYLEGKLAEYLEQAGKLENKRVAIFKQFCAHLGLGRLAEAERLAAQSTRGYVGILMHLGWLAKGDAGQARRWRERAIEHFRRGVGEDQIIAKLLEKGEALGAEDIDRVPLNFADRSLIFLALAAACPRRREGLLDLAQRLNYDLYFPHRFVRSVIAALRKPQGPARQRGGA